MAKLCYLLTLFISIIQINNVIVPVFSNPVQNNSKCLAPDSCGPEELDALGLKKRETEDLLEDVLASENHESSNPIEPEADFSATKVNETSTSLGSGTTATPKDSAAEDDSKVVSSSDSSKASTTEGISESSSAETSTSVVESSSDSTTEAVDSTATEVSSEPSSTTEVQDSTSESTSTTGSTSDSTTDSKIENDVSTSEASLESTTASETFTSSSEGSTGSESTSEETTTDSSSSTEMSPETSTSELPTDSSPTSEETTDSSSSTEKPMEFSSTPEASTDSSTSQKPTEPSSSTETSTDFNPPSEVTTNSTPTSEGLIDFSLSSKGQSETFLTPETSTYPNLEATSGHEIAISSSESFSNSTTEEPEDGTSTQASSESEASGTSVTETSTQVSLAESSEPKASSVASSTETSSVAPSTEASSVAPSTETSSVAPSTEASSVAYSTEIPSVASNTEIPSVAPSTEASSVASSTEIPSVASSTEDSSVATSSEASSAITSTEASSFTSSTESSFEVIDKATSGTINNSSKYETTSERTFSTTPLIQKITDKSSVKNDLVDDLFPDNHNQNNKYPASVESSLTNIMETPGSLNKPGNIVESVDPLFDNEPVRISGNESSTTGAMQDYELDLLRNGNSVGCLLEDREKFKRSLTSTVYSETDGEPTMLTFLKDEFCVGTLSKSGRYTLRSRGYLLPQLPLKIEVEAGMFMHDRLYLFDSSPAQRVWSFKYETTKRTYSLKSHSTISTDAFLQVCGIKNHPSNNFRIKAIAQFSLKDPTCIVYDQYGRSYLSQNPSAEAVSLVMSIQYLVDTQYIIGIQSIFAWLDDEPSAQHVYVYGSNGELYELFRNNNTDNLWPIGNFRIIPYENFPIPRN